MRRRIQIIAGATVLATVLFIGIGYTEQPVAETYRYDYQHRLSSDYIYRTGRVLTAGAKREEGESASALRREQQDMNASTTSVSDTQEQEVDLPLAVKGMVRQLLQSGGEDNVSEHVVAVSTFVNLNQLYRTSSLGRYLSEQLISNLHEAGVQVIEVRKTPGLMVRENFGEYALSRNMAELSYVQKADAILAGTYTFVDDRLFVNARLLDNEDGLVLASASFESKVGSLISAFLADEGMPVRLQRPIKVKTLAEKVSY